MLVVWKIAINIFELLCGTNRCLNIPVNRVFSDPTTNLDLFFVYIHDSTYLFLAPPTVLSLHLLSMWTSFFPGKRQRRWFGVEFVLCDLWSREGALRHMEKCFSKGCCMHYLTMSCPDSLELFIIIKALPEFYCFINMKSYKWNKYLPSCTLRLRLPLGKSTRRE